MLSHRVIISRIAGVLLVIGGLYSTSLYVSHAAISYPGVPATGAVSSTLIGTVVAQKPSLLQPKLLDIVSISASIPIIDVGLTSTHNLDVPNNFVQAGWYEYGPVPGQEGSAVIDGHVDNGGFTPTIDGVFKYLDQVKLGDIITVQLSNGSSVDFKVIDSSVYATDNFPSNLVFNQTGAAYLKLITCHGTWEPSLDTYSQRLVLTAVRV